MHKFFKRSEWLVTKSLRCCNKCWKESVQQDAWIVGLQTLTLTRLPSHINTIIPVFWVYAKAVYAPRRSLPFAIGPFAICAGFLFVRHVFIHLTKKAHWLLLTTVLILASFPDSLHSFGTTLTSAIIWSHCLMSNPKHFHTFLCFLTGYLLLNALLTVYPDNINCL
jgi:hypothetical protein